MFGQAINFGSLAAAVEAIADFLTIAGGASGGADVGGAGGAGGLRTSYGSTSGGGASAESQITLAAETYTFTIGAGGAAATGSGQIGNSGVNSSIAASSITTITSTGGGGGGATNDDGLTGGSGGGSGRTGAAGAGTSSQGYAGGIGTQDNETNSTAGGGGGASALQNELGRALLGQFQQDQAIRQPFQRDFSSALRNRQQQKLPLNRIALPTRSNPFAATLPSATPGGAPIPNPGAPRTSDTQTPAGQSRLGSFLSKKAAVTPPVTG